MAAERKAIQGRHPLYRGVRKRRWGNWVSEIRHPKKQARIWLGSFSTPEMAARAHDAASLYLRGDVVMLNFPHLADSLPCPASLDARDIKRAASMAAFTFNHITAPKLEVERGVISASKFTDALQKKSPTRSSGATVRRNGEHSSAEESAIRKVHSEINSCFERSVNTEAELQTTVETSEAAKKGAAERACTVRDLDPFFYDELLFNTSKTLEEIAVAMLLAPPQHLNLPIDLEPWILPLWD